MKKFWECKQSVDQDEADIYIFGEITSFKWDESDTTASSFQKDLKELGDVKKINLHVNSPGGSVFEGIAIGNMLKQHKAYVTAYVDALAASIASVIVVSNYQRVPEKFLMTKQENQIDDHERKKIIEQAKKDKEYITNVLGGL